jgi:hypothetical protein
LKFRRDRRPSLPLESALSFYPRYLFETAAKVWRYLTVYRQSKAILKDVLAAPDRWTYSDIAIAPPASDEFEMLDLYHATAGSEAALARKHRHEEIRSKVMAAETAPT